MGRNAEKKIKILCTLGPASMSKDTIARMDELSVDVFRINLSHTKIEQLENIILQIKKHTNKPICLDTEGAQIRTGYVENNRIYLENDRLIEITNKTVLGNADRISLNPSDAITEINIGDLISVDFESLLLQVVASDRNGIKAKVVSSGYLGSNKAVNIDRYIKLPTMSIKDKEAVKIGRKHGVSHFALSFTNRGEDVSYFRKYVGKKAHIICKIESLEGVNNVDEILDVADAILIDRGDLSREVASEKIPFVQKLIINKANKKDVPVYVATNLLESMVKTKTPTRAEVSDIINTLMDGADGLVLAAETAIGAYPTNCVAMVSRLINQFLTRDSADCSIEHLHKRSASLLVAPHGGVLVNRIMDRFDPDRTKKLKTLKVQNHVLLDAEQIAVGTFSPLEGFMNKKELDSVVTRCNLPNGLIWPVPVVLQLDQVKAKGLKAGENVLLVLENTGEAYAIVHVEEIYRYDLKKIAKEVYDTLDDAHPGVRTLNQGGEYFLGGKIELIKRMPSEFKQYEITPKQARMVFESRGWVKVVGFHTRNVVHRAHEYIQMHALENSRCDGLFIHPVVGPKKEGDYSAGAILKSYELMVSKFYPKDKVFLSAFQNYSRYAGPREAIFTALCRKNFGCSHFIVGRDHAGVGNYYGPKDAHNLFKRIGDIGITPIFFDDLYYCRKCDQYVEKCKHGEAAAFSISGTQGRAIFRSKKCPPDWFMRKEVSNIILNEIDNQNEVFLK